MIRRLRLQSVGCLARQLSPLRVVVREEEKKPGEKGEQNEASVASVLHSVFQSRSRSAEERSDSPQLPESSPLYLYHISHRGPGCHGKP